MRARFSAQWALLHPTVVYRFQDDPEFSDGSEDPPQNANWVNVVTLTGVEPRQVEFGVQGRFRRGGILRVQFWLVADDGAGIAAEYRDSVAAIFEGNTTNVAGVRFYATGTAEPVGREERWLRYQVDTRYDTDTLR